MAFDHTRTRTEFLTSQEFKILTYLSGRAASIEKVANETKIKKGECAKFLKQAAKLDLVRKSETSTQPSPPRSTDVSSEFYARFPIPILSAPSSVDLFITSRCNLKCIHCFSTTREAVDLSFEEVESILDQLEQAGVLELRINGGEPLLHPDIGRILQTLERRRFLKVILTNGTLISDALAKQLKKSNVIPTVSLDDSEAQGHDAFRGTAGTFEKTLAGLKVLVNNKVVYGINCCLHTKNLSRIERIVNFAETLGACRIAFLSLKPLGRMSQHAEWMLSPKEYEAALPRLLATKAKHRWIDVSLDSFLSCPVLKEAVVEAKKGYVSCRAGRTIMSIFSDGWAYPCNSVVGDLKWRMGNLRKETLTDIWFSRNWAFFRGAVKKADLKRCRRCEQMDVCRDFYCRLLPYATSGNALGPSPACSST